MAQIIEEEKFFSLDGGIESFPMSMYIIARRCAGEDSEYDWSKFNSVEIDIVRSKNLDPDDEVSYTVVSSKCTEFTVQELADDLNSDSRNLKVERLMDYLKKFSPSRVASEFFIRVTVISEE